MNKIKEWILDFGPYAAVLTVIAIVFVLFVGLVSMGLYGQASKSLNGEWEVVVPETTLGYPSLFRMRTPDGWIVSTPHGLSVLHDPEHAWVPGAKP